MCSIIRVSTAAVPATTALERGVELGQRRLGEEAEAAEVHGEDRDVGRRRARCGRAVASSVPSPPRTTIRSTSDGSASARDGAMRTAAFQRRAAPRRGRRRCPARFSQAIRSRTTRGPPSRRGLTTMPTRRDGQPVHGVSLSGPGVSPHQNRMRQELPVAFGAGDGRRRQCRGARDPAAPPRPRRRRPPARGRPDRARCRPRRRRRGPASNCGLTSATTSAARREQRHERRQHQPQRDERHVDGDEIEARGASGPSSVRGQGARVDLLDHDDARDRCAAPGELAVADVERDDARRAALQQHVGEAAGRRADVERRRSRADRGRRRRARGRA